MPLLNWVNDTRARSAASEVPFHLLKKISSYGDKSEAKKNLEDVTNFVSCLI